MEEQCTALQAAAKEGKKEIFDLLLELGAMINGVPGKDGYVIHYALQSDDSSMASFVLDRGAIVDDSSAGNSSLATAMRCGKCTVIPLLVERGADVNACSPALSLDRWSEKDHVAYHFLIQKGASFGRNDGYVLSNLISEGSMDSIKQLLADGMDPNSYDQYQASVLVCPFYPYYIISGPYLLTTDLASNHGGPKGHPRDPARQRS